MARRRRRSLSSQLGIKKSASFGNKGARVSVGTRGVRVSSKNPLTGKRKSKTLYSTSRRSRSGCTSILLVAVLLPAIVVMLTQISL